MKWSEDWNKTYAKLLEGRAWTYDEVSQCFIKWGIDYKLWCRAYPKLGKMHYYHNWVTMFILHMLERPQVDGGY